jgi:CRISPR/Cas system CMR-associated protein Cmr5 small subunit
MNPQFAEKIIEAKKAIQKVKIVKDNGRVDSVFKGYIASFGPSLVANGLLPAVLIYEKEEKEKGKVTQAIRYLLDSKETGKLSEYLQKENRYKNYQILREVADYVIALKLALSMFTLEENGEAKN